MEFGYILLALVVWAFLSLPALLYAMVANRNRRGDIDGIEDKLDGLRRDLESMQRRLQLALTEGTVTQSVVTNATPAAQPATAAHQQVEGPVTALPEVRILAQPVTPTHSPEASHSAPPAHAPLIAPKPAAVAAAERRGAPASLEKPAPAITPPPSPPPPPVISALPAKAPETAPTASAPTKPVAPPIQPPAVHPAAPIVKVPPAPPAVAAASSTPHSPVPPPPAPKAAEASTAVPPSLSARPPIAASPISAQSPIAAKKRSRSIEEMIGTNWLPKIGVVIIVIGLAFFTAENWSHVTSWWQLIGPVLRSLAVLLAGLGMMYAGVRFEKNERYRILGHAMIGGGWATIFLIAWAIGHAPAFVLLTSNAADLAILLAVTGVMVWHTLKYDSQTVTGLAFLLGFAAVMRNPDPPFNLIAGALLIAGMTVIVLRRQWYQLEVFGIVASFGNHFYWLYTAFQKQQRFPDHTASVALVIAYWVIFRISYLTRKISTPRQETISTLAGLLNPLLFLGVMKYQSFHPEWAFPALLTMGAVEFALGQLPVSRQRLAPFQILSSLGAALMVIAVPIKYAGHTHEMVLLWLVGAELFLLAGILLRERLFRGFGLIISCLIAAYALPVHVAPLAEKVLDRQPCHDGQLGIVLGVLAVALYANAHLTRWLRRELFASAPETPSLQILSYVAGVFAAAAVYASFPDATVALILAALVVLLTWTGKRGAFAELIYQGHGVAAVAVWQAIVSGAALDARWFGLPARMVSFAIVAAALYLSSRFVRQSETHSTTVFAAAYALSASAMLTLLIWFQGPAWAVAVLWIVLALALALVGHALQRTDLKWHAFALVWLAAGRALTFNFDLTQPFYSLHAISMRLATVTMVALGTYLLAVWAPRLQLRAAYTVIGTLLAGALIFKEVESAWIIVGWAALALVLTAADVWIKQLVYQPGELKWQALALATLAFGWAWPNNFNLDQPFYFTSLRLATISLTALAIYLLARWAPMKSMRPLYSLMGTALLAALAYTETKTPWTSVAWISLAFVLGVAGRLWKDRALLWQTHALSALAVGWTLYANFADHLRETPVQLISVGVTSILLYLLTRITNVAGVIEDYRMTWAYPWAGSLLLSWLAWYQIPPNGVSVAWGAFGFVLFELPELVKTFGIDAGKSAANWRAQAYVALFSGFAHLFYANFNSPATGGFLHVLMDSRLMTVYPLVPIYLIVYWRMYHEAGTGALPTPGSDMNTKAVSA